MKSIKVALWGSLGLISLLWLISEQASFAALAGFFDWRNVLVQYSGVVSITVMSLAMILAARPRIAERLFGGLDKTYRLHKWLGIAALVVSVSHWLIAKGPKWAVGLGWLERRGRPPRPHLPDGSLQQLLASQRGLAESVGEWAFYAALVLMVLALVKYFPYRRFFQTHRILAITYLAFVFHAVILLKFDDWTRPVGLVVGVLMVLGSISAVLCLARRHLSGRPVAGRVAGCEWQGELATLAVDIQLDAGWPGHQAGQFAFVTFHADEGPHPYTLASAWQGDGQLRLLIKALGDYTRTLPDRLAVGDRVVVEGPYGCFTFAGEGKRQIWVSGGIGITPFVARMQALAREADGKPVDLFHCTGQMNDAVLGRLQEDARLAGVSLHLYWRKRFEVRHLLETVADWREADIWFCGPAPFGRQLRAALLALGLPAGRFHQELFEMR